MCSVAGSTGSAPSDSYLSFVFQKKQREFEEYIRDKYITAKADFRTLLKETKFITYRWGLLVQDAAFILLCHTNSSKLMSVTEVFNGAYLTQVTSLCLLCPEHCYVPRPQLPSSLLHQKMAQSLHPSLAGLSVGSRCSLTVGQLPQAPCPCHTAVLFSPLLADPKS